MACSCVKSLCCHGAVCAAALCTDDLFKCLHGAIGGNVRSCTSVQRMLPPPLQIFRLSWLVTTQFRHQPPLLAIKLISGHIWTEHFNAESILLGLCLSIKVYSKNDAEQSCAVQCAFHSAANCYPASLPPRWPPDRKGLRFRSL